MGRIRLDRPDPRHLHHPVPVLLDAAHRAVQREVAGTPSEPAAGRLHLGCVQARARAVDHSRRPRPRADRARRSTSGCTCSTRSIVATLITAGQVFFSAMAAYAFSRMRWPGRDKVFGCSWPR